MLAKASGSGLKQADVTRLQLTAFTSELLTSIVGLPQYLTAFTIPYFDFKGKPTKFFRVRYLENPTGFAALVQKKPIKYAQPKGTRNELYLAPFCDWEAMRTSEESLIITEGELKAACATKRGLPTIGLGGVTMFSARKQGKFVLPDLARFNCKNRRVYVIFDSDAATNPNVLRAEATLCRELTELGAQPFIVRLPKLEDDEKTGLDDYLNVFDNDTLIALMTSSPMYTGAEALHKLNEEVIYVNGSDIVYNPAEDLRMNPKSFAGSHYANRRYLAITANGAVEKSAAAEWVKWESRSEVKSFTYQPGDEQITEERQYNLWQPWPHTPVKGDVKLWQKLMDHIFYNTPAEVRHYFQQWVAYPMQHPGAKLKQAVIFWGGQGTGKSFVGEIIMRLYGAHNSTKFQNSDLIGNFNDWAEHKQFAVGEEIVVHAGEKRTISEMLKTIVTDTTINIHRKYLNAYTLPNCMNVFLASNHAAALKLEEDDRRFFVHQVKAPRMQKELYGPLDTWSRSEEGLAALFHYFLTYDLRGFDPQAQAMVTADKMHMISGGRSEHGTWVAELKETPDEVLKIGAAVVPFSLFSAEDLLRIYMAKHERTNVTAVTMSNELSMQGFTRAYPHVIRTNTGSKRLWVIRHQAEFSKMSPGQLGDYYNAERGKLRAGKR